MGITLNITPRNVHMPEVKRYIRTIKERVRAITNLLPFKKYPPRTKAEMVYNVVFWLNSFPHKEGIHTTISPRTLILGLAIDFHKHCKIAFKERIYMEVTAKITGVEPERQYTTTHPKTCPCNVNTNEN